MNRTLVAILAIATTVAVVALIAWAGTTVYDGNVQATTFVGALTGAVTGNLAGDVTGDLNAGTAEADTLDITGSAVGVGTPALPTASVHAGRFATNAAADTLYWSDGTNWQQLAPRGTIE